MPKDEDYQMRPGQDLPETEAPESGEPGDFIAADDDSAEVENLRAELAAWKQKASEAIDKSARAQADFTNSRRRLEQEGGQRLNLAVGRIVKDLLPVLDNLERALAVDDATTDVKSVKTGVQGVYAQFVDIMRQQQVQRLMPKPGDEFDPNTMQALMQEESAEVEAGKVTRTFQPGYAYEGRNIRPAQVAVAK